MKMMPANSDADSLPRLLQTTPIFSVGLSDYYGQLSTATSSGTCQIVSPTTQLLLTEQGRIASIQNGSAVFAQFDATGKHSLNHYMHVMFHGGGLLPNLQLGITNSIWSANCLGPALCRRHWQLFHPECDLRALSAWPAQLHACQYSPTCFAYAGQCSCMWSRDGTSWVLLQTVPTEHLRL